MSEAVSLLASVISLVALFFVGCEAIGSLADAVARKRNGD